MKDMDTAFASTVVLLRCKDYDEQRVAKTVACGVDLLGGIGQFVKTGERILLKPNLLVAKVPERAVTTRAGPKKAAAR